jgi:protein-tyrosine phosphatase
MVDAHCHLLPGFDGGPKDIEAALQMVLVAGNQGVQVIAATPHFADSDYRTQIANANALGAALSERLRARGCLVDLHIAGELRIGQRLARAIVMNQIPILGTLGNDRVILVALPDRIPKNIVGVIEWMRMQKIVPLLSRTESHREVLKDPRVLKPMRDAGALIEINAAALAGRHGPYAQRRAREMLELGWGFLLSSDARAGEIPGALLEVGRVAASVIVGEQAAWDLVWKQPARVVAPYLLDKGSR